MGEGIVSSDGILVGGKVITFGVEAGNSGAVEEMARPGAGNNGAIEEDAAPGVR